MLVCKVSHSLQCLFAAKIQKNPQLPNKLRIFFIFTSLKVTDPSIHTVVNTVLVLQDRFEQP